MFRPPSEVSRARRFSNSLWLALFVFLNVASGESPYRDLLSGSNNEVRPTYVLKSEEALEDLQTLERVLSQGYAGYETLESGDLKWSLLFREMEREVSSRERWRQEEFLDFLKRHLTSIADLHLGLVFREEWVPLYQPERVFFTGLVVRKEATAPLTVIHAPPGHSEAMGGALLGIEEAADRRFLFKTLPGKTGVEDFLVGKWSKQSHPDPLPIRVRTEEGEILEWDQPLHSPKCRLSAPSLRPFRLTYIPFPRIEIRTFSILMGNPLEQFLQSAEKAKAEKKVVVDLRGNPGGSDRYGREWLARLFGKRSHGWEVSELVSPVTFQGDVLLHRWLLSRSKLTSQKKDLGGRLAFAEEQLELAEKEKVERHWKRSIQEDSLSDTEADEAFEGTLLLFVDSNTGSSAETFVLLAKQFPQTVVLGENTKGMARFGEIKLYPLPHSGIWIQAGSKKFTDPTNSFVEGKGFLPDYWLDDSESISEIVEGMERAVPER